MTDEELQNIISAVLSSIRTNSKTIDQLTAVETLGESDFFEVNGGRKISYPILASLISSITKEDAERVAIIANNAIKVANESAQKADTATAEIDALKSDVDALDTTIADINSKLSESFDFIPFAGASTVVAENIIQDGAPSTGGEVFFNVPTQTFIYLLNGSYYGEWLNGDDYGEFSSYGHLPKENAVYYTESALYKWNGSVLNEIFGKESGGGSDVDTSKFATAEQGAKADTAIQHVGVESYSWSKGEQIYNGTYLNAQRAADENGNYVAVNIDAKIIEVGDAAADNDGLVSAYQLKGLLEALSTGLNERITALDQKITAMQSGNTTEGIDSLDEVKSFLEGMKDTEVLEDKLIEAGAMDEATVTNIATEIVEEKLQNIDGEITSSYDEDEGKLTLS